MIIQHRQILFSLLFITEKRKVRPTYGNHETKESNQT